MSSSSDDDSFISSSSGEPAIAAIASPPRGKQLHPPSSDDEAPFATIVHPPPRGKELHLLAIDSDDEPLAKKATKPKKTPKKKPNSKKKSPRKPAKKRKDPPTDSDSDDAVAAVVVDEDDDAVAVIAEPVKRKKKKKEPVPLYKLASLETLKAAEAAREKLRDAVTSLPYKVNDSYVIRSFGVISTEGEGIPHALYPVGFSCDRYEFSPVHGRIIKMRCEILDGKLIKGDRKIMEEKLGDGPVFRVMWGPGIEADENLADGTFPFHPSDTTTVKTVEKPTVGTRVAVKFDGNKIYEGKITRVATNPKKSSSDNTIWNISILYDDGVTENTFYPDADITLHPAGYPPIHQEKGWVTELHGQPVHSVLAKTPLEAWGKTLLSLGLIDEIIYEEAIDIVEKSRLEALSEARDRINSINKKRRDDRAKMKHGHATRHSTDDGTAEDDVKSETKSTENGDNEVAVITEDQSEPSSEQEVQLREKLERLKKDLVVAENESREISVRLAHARISTISPFATNPFLFGTDASSQDQSLMASAVKKEKTKMGNTGNKRKVVTPATMLDRSDTFFTPDIEQLIEGLTNSELAPLYVFHANRSYGVSNLAWAYEAKVRHENAMKKKLEKEQKLAEEAEAKALVEAEKSMKRKAKDEEAASKKRQREEEEDQKKRERIEKRLTQLTTQLDERLSKESFFSNEKAISAYVKALNKEFARRRKVADAVISHKMDQLLPSISDDKSTAFPTYGKMLPPLSSLVYDESVVRIWDFLHCFSDAFVTDSSDASIPSLDSIQNAIDDLRKGSSIDSKKYSAAVALVEGIAIILCKAISPGLTKYLAASSYQYESNKGSSDESACLPVTASTWREVARMSFISDLLIDLGYSKNESANIVKGYRSGGHPNSKEAKRWKKIEDSPVVMLYQQLNDESNDYRRQIVTSRLSAPSNPSCSPSDWRFFLHNVRSRTPNSVSYIKSNVEKSLSALKKSSKEVAEDEAQRCIYELEHCLTILKQTPSDHSADPELLKAKQIAMDVLDSTRKKPLDTHQSASTLAHQCKESPRLKMGLLKRYELSSDEYRKLELSKEDYMVAAIKLKEELENQNKDGTGVLSDDDDDEDEGEALGGKTDDESKPDVEMKTHKSENPVVQPASNLSLTADQTSKEGESKENEAVATSEPINQDAGQEATVPSENAPLNDEECGGASSDYEFCSDISSAPEPIRRCLAVVRTLCASSSADPFIYPVDPQLYPGYYESVISPMSLYDVGIFLQKSVHELSSDDDASVERIVTDCGRKTRKIFQNSLSYNTGNKEHLTMNSAEEMLRLFERLFFDWVLAPDKPSLQDLDDDKCIDSHDDDIMSMVILCDACEGKYNMSRLKPPLLSVPAGEWYCPRCMRGRCWITVDPRIGRKVQNGTAEGTIESCKFAVSEEGEYSLFYCISDDKGSKYFCSLKDVDEAIIGDPIDPVSFLDALAECPGYSFGRDAGILGNTLPLTMDPFVDDKAANSALSSTVYQDTVLSCVSLMHSPEDLSSNEWVTLLMLLIAKCSSSDTVLELSSNLENKEASTLASAITTFWRARGAKNIVPDISSDFDDESDEETAAQEFHDEPSKSNDSMDADTASSTDNKTLNNSSNDGSKTNDEDVSEKPTISPEEEQRRKNRESALFTKTIRQKKREETLVGYYVQNSLKSTVSSLEEDPLASLLNSTIFNQEEGLNITSVRCRGESCHFCHLADTTICSPMCRVPSDSEWNEIFPHAVHERNSYMVAQMPSPPTSEEEPKQEPVTKVCIVRVRVGGELITERAKTLDYPSKVLDQPLIQFLPRNAVGFQNELKFRQESNLSVVSGSLTAHEVCAIAAHRMRKEHYLKDRREHCKATLARDAAISCGKSIPIGQDQYGRTYWIFKAEPTTLFICDLPDSNTINDKPTVKWHRFSTPEAIASVMVGLGKGAPSESLREAYPEAWNLVKSRMWSTLLLQRALELDNRSGTKFDETTQHQTEAEKDSKPETPFVEDEDVMVESENGTLLWDAVVVDTSKDSTGGVNGYFVHFKGWSSRFDCWVPCHRVVEANPANLEIQDEVLGELDAKMENAGGSLEEMFAMQSLQATNWKNAKYLAPSDLLEFAHPRPDASHDEKSLLLLKGSILLIEAALPKGAIEYWPAHAALLWSKFVKDAQGPESLLKCVLLLEDAISPKFMRAQATQLLSALPRQWRAMGEASISSVALRVAVLDHILKYSKV